MEVEEENGGEWVVGQSMGYYEIVMNKNNIVGQQYTIPEDGSFVIEDELEIYRMRKLQNQYLVKVLDLKKTRSNSMCLGQNSIKIITQRIPYRLDEVMNLTQNQALYTLYCCLHGFKVICEMLGPVSVEQRMIGVDPNGCIKVWLNENYSRNYAEVNNKVGIVKDKAIQKMVTSIMEAIKTYNLPEDLVMKLRRILSTSMEQHLGVIEKYLKQKRIDINRIKVKLIKQQKSAIEGQGRNHEKGNVSSFIGADESSTSMIEGIPHPVAQLVHRIFKPKFFGNEKQKSGTKQEPIKILEAIQENKNQLAVPPIKVNPPSKVMQNNNQLKYPIPQNANNRPRSQLPNAARPVSPLPMNNFQKQIRPPSSNIAAQKYLNMPAPVFVQGQFPQQRGFSPRPTSPRPNSPNPQFNQYQTPYVQSPPQQYKANPQNINIPAINVKKQNIDYKQKRQKDMAQSQCRPLNMQYSECFPLQKPPQISQQQYQRMMAQQMGHPFGPMFAQQMMDPQLFMPPVSPNFMLGMSPNMPPPMSHLSPNMNQIHQQHQFIHSQLLQNLSNQFQPQFYPNTQGYPPGNSPAGFQKNRF